MPWKILSRSGDADEVREAFGLAVSLVHEARTQASALKRQCDQIIAQAKAANASAFDALEQWATTKKGLEARLRNAIELHYLDVGDRNPWPGLGIRDTEKEEVEFDVGAAVAWVLDHPDMHWVLSVQGRRLADYVLALPEEAREALGIKKFATFETKRKVTATIAKDLGGKV